MKDLTIKEFEVMLCSIGYLPPRNEDELSFFFQMNEGHRSCLENRHVDIDAILSGRCRVESDFDNHISLSMDQCTMVAEGINNVYSMAARNYENLPKDILDKMRNQHIQHNDAKD